MEANNPAGRLDMLAMKILDNVAGQLAQTNPVVQVMWPTYRPLVEHTVGEYLGPNPVHPRKAARRTRRGAVSRKKGGN